MQKNTVTLLDLERKEDSIPKLLAQESFVAKSLRVDSRNTFPMVREGDIDLKKYLPIRMGRNSLPNKQLLSSLSK